MSSTAHVIHIIKKAHSITARFARTDLFFFILFYFIFFLYISRACSLLMTCNDLVPIIGIIGSLSNYDDDGNKKPTNLHI